MTPEERDRLVTVESDMRHMRRDLDSMAKDVKRLLAIVEQRGNNGWLTITLGRSLLLSIGGALGWVVNHFTGNP